MVGAMQLVAHIQAAGLNVALKVLNQYLLMRCARWDGNRGQRGDKRSHEFLRDEPAGLRLLPLSKPGFYHRRKTKSGPKGAPHFFWGSWRITGVEQRAFSTSRRALLSTGGTFAGGM